MSVAASATASAVATVSAIAAPVGSFRAAKIAAALQDAPPIDILVSTPSINVRKPLLNISDEEFDKVIALNLRGTASQDHTGS